LLAIEEALAVDLQFQIDLATEQIAIANEQIEILNAQLNAILGLNVSVLSLAAAIGGYQSAQANLAAAQAAQTAGQVAARSAVGGGYMPPSISGPSAPEKELTYLERYPDVAADPYYGLHPWEHWMSSGKDEGRIWSGPKGELQHFVGPNTWVAGQSGDRFWEAVLADFNALHASMYGIPMNRPWSSDAESRASKAALDTAYSISRGGYAEGGYHEGGWRVVGERGPELEYTGASQIFSSNQSKALMDMSEVVEEVRQLRMDLEKTNYQMLKNSNKVTKFVDKWDGDGLPATRTV